MKFQVPNGFFKGVAISDDKRQELNDVVHHRVRSLLQDEQRYADRASRKEHVLHPADWTSMGRGSDQQELQIYRRRLRGRSLRQLAMEEDFLEARVAVDTGHPSMVAIGYVNGTMEDMMYGMSATSQADLKTGFSYKAPPKECALLGNLESATVEDPFHSADIIWALPDLPRMVHQVDICYLKATGIGYDSEGTRYGYLVLHSVDLPECPPFQKPRFNIIRAKMFFACLFRQERPGSLYVLVRGIFNLNGAVKMQYMLRAATASFIGGLFNGVGIGESKKLTLMARRNQEELQNLAQKPMPSECSYCQRQRIKTRLSRADPRAYLEECRVCGVTICSTCLKENKSRSYLFLGPKKVCQKYPCCPTCVQNAKRMTGIRPSDPEFEVVADYYRIQRSKSQSQVKSSPSSSSSPGGSPPPTVVNTMPRNWGRDGPLKTSNSEGMWTNSTANDSSVDGHRFSDLSELNSADYNSGSDREDVDELVFDVEPEPETMAGTATSEIVPWNGGARISVDDDFTTARDNNQAARAAAEYQQNMWRRMLAMKRAADAVYIQTRRNEALMQEETFQSKYYGA